MAQKQENPFDAIDAVLNETARKQTLLDFAKANNLRVTSGFSRGGHNTGSMHYQGSPDDPGAIDVDHRGVDLGKLIAAAQSAGYNVRDERSRPAGQRVWGGPHIHLSKGGKPQTRPTTSPVTPSTTGPVDLSLPLAYDAQGNLVQRTTAPDLGKEIEAYVQQNIPQSAPLEQPKPSPQTVDDFGAIDEILMNAGKPQSRDIGSAAGAVTMPKTSNFLTDLGDSLQNAASGYTRDDLVRRSGNGLGAGIGNVLSGVGYIGGSALAGAGLGSVVPGAGTVGGGIGGAVAGGTAVGALQEAQRQRLQEGFKGYDPLRIGGAGVIGGVTSLPVGGVASTLGKTILKNAGIDAAINAGGDVALQAVEKGTIDPRRLDIGRTATAAGIGAAGGAVGGGLAFKGRPTDLGEVSGFVNRAGQEILPNEPSPYGFVRQGGEEINPRLTPEEQAALNRPVGDLNTPEQVRDLNQAFVGRQGSEAEVIDPRKADLPEELGPIKTEMSEGGIEIATRAGTREIPQVLDAQGNPIKDLADVNTAKPQGLADNAATDISLSPPRDMAAALELPGRATTRDLLDATGQPLRRDISEAVDMVPGTAKMKELVQDNQIPVPTAKEIKEGVNQLPATDEPLNPAKPRTLETVQAAQGQGVELMNVTEAREFMQKYRPDSLPHFDNVLEAAKNNQTASVMHRPLAGGGANLREIHPVDFGKKTIQGRTEVSNLIKEFSPGAPPTDATFAAVRDNLVQRLAANKIQVSAKEQNITGKTPRAAKRILNQLASRLPEHERTHVYIMDHNLDVTERGQTYGFRRLDRITESGLTGKPQAVPQASQYQNKIKPAFDAMRQMADLPDTPPEVAKAIKNLTNKGVIGRKEGARMKEWLRNNYTSFCKLFGLE